MKSTLKIRGVFRLFTRKKGEEWIKRVELKNLIVDQGLNNIRNLVANGTGSKPGFGAFSDNTTTPTASDTSLGGNEVRKAFTGSGDISVSKKVSFEWLAETTDWGSITSISKAGLYTSSTGTNLWSAAKFTAITVDNTIEALGQWTWEFSDA